MLREIGLGAGFGPTRFYPVDVEHSSEDMLYGHLIAEREPTRTRLLVEAPEVFAKVDRLRAEGEFRSAVALPLVLVGGAFAARGWWWALLVASVIALLLALQGVQRYGQSNASLAEAVRVGLVSSPTQDAGRALYDSAAPDQPHPATNPSGR